LRRGWTQAKPWRQGQPHRFEDEGLPEAGVQIAVPLQTLDYGMREFEARDPDGHKLVFGRGVTED